MISNRIALGTVQFGLDYGINNAHGEVKKEEVFNILRFAYENGIDTLDTASAYGSSETKLGIFFHENNNCEFKIVSKLAPQEEISEKAMRSSLEKLKKKKLYGYLAHDFGMFNKDINLIKKFTDLKQTGLTEKIGFSLYYPSDLKFLLDNKINFDLVQIPYNIFDQRFEEWFNVLKENKIEVHVRSCFLQGLFFMEPSKLPEKLKELSTKLKKLREISQVTTIPINVLCMGFCLSNSAIDKIVLGVDSLSDLKMNLLNAKKNIGKEILAQLTALKETNENLILPVNW